MITSRPKPGRDSQDSCDSLGTNPVCVKGLLLAVFCARSVDPRGARGSGGRSVVVGFGSGLSEVPAFRDLPATLDSESSLVALPNPLSLAVEIGAKLSIDGVAAPAFQ